MRFSVIIPVYNKGPYVSKAIQSVLVQTFRDFELIIVDDGSKDDSLAEIRRVLAGTVIPCQIITQENAGVSTARNNGVAESRGDYLCFLDADDWWAPSFLLQMNWLIEQYPEAEIYGTNYYYVKNGRERVCVKGVETGYINYCKVYAKGMCMPLTSISVAVPRPVFVRNHGFKSHLKFGEDFDLWIRIALDNKVAFLDIPLAYYNQDVNPLWRGIGHLVSPSAHMLWNLDYLSEVERSNPDYKELIDKLRVYGLLPYYLSLQYHDVTIQELARVDWSKQSKRTRNLYKQPVFILKSRQFFLKYGSFIKQWMIKHL